MCAKSVRTMPGSITLFLPSIKEDKQPACVPVLCTSMDAICAFGAPTVKLNMADAQVHKNREKERDKGRETALLPHSVSPPFLSHCFTNKYMQSCGGEKNND